MAHRRQKRRGVLLLVSLVLLVLFLMLGVTFVLMAGNFRRSSEAYRRLQESGDTTAQAGDLLHGVARDLVRGTHNPESPFSKENLLEDMYGQPALRGKVKIGTTPSVAPNTGGQFTELTITADADFTFSNVAGYYSGLVLTMVTGKAAGQSTRIVHSSSNTLTVMTLPGWVTDGAFDGEAAPQADDLILVNGRPFSGDGTGHATGATTRRLNEDYDAADLNNPWLAALAATQASWSNANFFWGSDPVGDGTNRPGGTTLAVDNDGDGTKESLWIDAGLPLQTQSDGSYVKPLVAMLVRDLDGRVNVNAHGGADQQAAFLYASGPIGQGYGPAEINPTLAFSSALSTGASNPSDSEQVTAAVLNSRHASDSASDSVPGAADDPLTLDIHEGDDALSAVAQFHHYGGDLNALVTPHDIDGTSTAVANATTGQIEFQDASGNTFTSGATNFQDDPYEMQLDTALGATPDDAPFTPAELEAVFRHRDVDAGSLPDRLQTALVVATVADKPAAYDSFRNLITTESWDLPVHPHALPEEVWQTISSLPPLQKALFENPGHITDLFKARMRHIDVDDPLNPGNPISTILDAEELQNSLNQLITDLGTGAIDDAISREMLSGLKFNVNRLFGNGQDDNGNGVVDEPGESGEMAYPGGIAGAPVASHFGDESSPIPFSYGKGKVNSLEARQEYAKQLYLLLMLCADIQNSGGGLESVVPAGSTPPEKRRLLARRLAQFAVNAVDYRDADAIMTGFEYDANPFDGWDADGDLDPSTPAGNNDIGVVWGAEAPAAVLTKTLAFHDRRVSDDQSVGGKTSEIDFTEIQTRLNTLVATETIPDPSDSEALGTFVNSMVDELREDPQNKWGQEQPFEDPHFDQFARPEGACFLEIHCLPQAYRTADLYDGDTLDLAKQTYDGSSDGVDNDDDGSTDETDGSEHPYPIWRVAISAPYPPVPRAGVARQAGLGDPPFYQLQDTNADRDADEASESGGNWNPHVTMQPDSFDALQDTPDSNGIANRVLIERVIYFPTTMASTVKTRLQQHQRDLLGATGLWDGIYYNTSPDLRLHANPDTIANLNGDPYDGIRENNAQTHLVIGPREQTTIRSLSFNGGQEIDIQEYNQQDTPQEYLPNTHKQSLCESSAGDPLSVSEPLPHDGTRALATAYPPNNSGAQYGTPIDEPFDHDADWLRTLANLFSQANPQYPASPETLTLDYTLDADGGSNDSQAASFDLEAGSTSSGGQPRYFDPVWAEIQEGTVPHYRTAFLQRLANPLLPWNPMPGVTAHDPALEVNPYMTVDAMPIDLNVYNSDSPDADPWRKVKTSYPPPSPPPALPLWDNFGQLPQSQAASLEGEIDTLLLEARKAPTYVDKLDEPGTTYFEFPTLSPLNGLRLRGDLHQPPEQWPLTNTWGASAGPGLNWLGIASEPVTPESSASPAPFWPNRPFVSQYELLMVPASEPGKLSFELGSYGPSTEDPQANFGDGFPHLLNFFYEDSSEPRLGRLFDYLHVPSRYAGTQTTLRPDTFKDVADFAPPFNRISNYREPGRVNLNTIEDPSVWESVMNGAPGDTTAHPGATYANIQSQLFRSSSYAELNGTQLTPPAQPPLLTSGGSGPTFADASQTADPFLRYGPINRLGNLVGTRSNVYAVWMTLGFFDVDNTGAVTGNEVGEDTGEIERHRAFYLIDRSIPVGYENGQDHNTEDVFRVQRFIE